MDTGPTIVTLRAAARALDSGTDREAVKAIQAAQDALDAAKATRLASLEVSRDFELDGASTLSTWVRNELRLSAKEAATLISSSATLSHLPEVAEAAAAGEIRAAHVAAFTYGLKHIGHRVVTESEPWLLEVARTCEPNELFRVVRALREAIYPDELDDAWTKGMDRQDIQLNAVPSGWHLTGFLSTVIGAKLKAVLDSISAPRDKDDNRSGSERRVDGFDQLVTTILEAGLPSDKGIRPHLSVIVDADTLDGAAGQQAGTTPAAGAPAQLSGFGSIGPQLLGYISCNADVTAILMRGNANVLDVGRSYRLATLKQRRAVIARQGGECAAPGCRNTHLEMHHPTWWSRGGKTSIDNLIGICSRCHHLVHRNLLVITPRGQGQFQFANADNRPLLKSYRQRRDIHRENWHIRRTARDQERRHTQRFENLRT